MLRIAVVVATTMLALAMAGPSAAEKSHRPDDILLCMGQPDTDVDDDPGSAIFSCCYADGCWICNNRWEDCVWDPAYSAQRDHLLLDDRVQTLDPGLQGNPAPGLFDGQATVLTNPTLDPGDQGTAVERPPLAPGILQRLPQR